MGDARFAAAYERVRDSANRVAEIRSLTDEDVIAALGGASRAADPLVANFLATEAMNRVQRGRRAIETIPEAIIALDSSGRFTYLNPAAERSLGWMHEDIVGRSLADTIEFIDAETALRLSPEEVMAPLRTTEVAQRRDVFVSTRDGRRLRAWLDATPVTVEETATGLLLTLQPAYEQRPEHGVLDAVSELSGNAVIILASDGTVAAWKESAERLFGFPAEAMLSRTLPHGLIVCERDDADLQRCAKRGIALREEPGIARRKDGALVSIRLSARPVPDADELVVVLRKDRLKGIRPPDVAAPVAVHAPSRAHVDGWRVFAAIAAIAAASLAGAGLAASLLGLPILASGLPGLVTMKANTAICLLLLSAGFGVVWRGKVKGIRRVFAFTLAGLAGLIGVATLAQYATGFNFGIDLLLPDPSRALNPTPGRMSIFTGLLTILSALTLVAHARAATPATQVLVSMSGILVLLGLAGYTFGAPEFLGAFGPDPSRTTIALTTLSAFALLTAAFVASRPEAGIAAMLRGESAASLLLRRLLPVTILGPIIITGLATSDLLQWQSQALREATLAIALILITTGVAVWTSRLVRAADERRDVARDELLLQKATLAAEVDARTADLQAANERLSGSVAQKETLLKEIHHRVKNNLQVTSGLLLLQARHAKDGPTRELFLESVSRVRSMALVHEKLYRSRGVADIDFGAYVRDFTADIDRASGMRERGILLECNAESVPLDLDTAVNAGLIVNELVSNAVKHAFPGGRRGTIVVTFERLPEDLLSITVTDDGVGFPPDLDVTSSRSMGLRLVHRLAKQLDGREEIAGDAGTKVRVVFPLPSARRPRLEEAMR